MRSRFSLTLRGLVVVLVAIGAMVTVGTPVSAQTCVDQPGFNLFDPTKDDNTLTASDLQTIATSFPDNEQLQTLVDRAANDPDFAGIQYAECTPGGGTTPAATTPVGTTPAGTTPVGTTPVDTTPGATTPVATTPADGGGDDGGSDDGGDDGSDDGSGDGVSELPDTGQGSANDSGSTTAMLFGAASVLMLAGAFMWRMRRLA